MPQGIVPAPYRPFDRHPDVAAQRSGSGRVRLSTWLHRRSLDEQIARGVQTDTDERLALRAVRLASRPERDRLARALERILEMATDPAQATSARPSPALGARVPLLLGEIRDCADDFEALARRLRDGESIDARGAVLTRRLLSEGDSPLYYPRSPVTLRHAVRSARLALEPISTPVTSALAA